MAVHDVAVTRLVAAFYVLYGLGFGIGTVWALIHHAQHGELPMTPWGFRALAGPAEQLGPSGFTALGAALAAVCALDVVAGIRLWQGRRDGLRLSLLTTVPATGLGLAFALPFLLLGVPIRLALAWAGRRSLR